MFEIKLLTRNLAIVLCSFSGLIANIGLGYSEKNSSFSVDFQSNLAIAQTETTKPLAIPSSDRLLPPSDIERKLSPLEKKRIRTEIEALEIEADALLAQDKQEQAFQLWFRQLRLYRAIDLLEEITALGNIGEIAWQANRKQELKVVTQRLNEIYLEQKTADSLTTELLTTLGLSYQQVRHLDRAIALYKTLLDRSRQADDIQLEKKYLESLGELYLDKFDYAQAAIVYEELIAPDYDDVTEVNQENYLLQLIEIYDYIKEPEKAIRVKTELIDYYLAQNNTEPIGDLLVTLGKDYQTLDEINFAIATYQKAITLGQQLQQLALVSDALAKLGNLYRKQQQYSLAIQTYDKLLDVEMQAYNSYGVMNSYDRLGQIYFILEDYERALGAFTEALEIAKTLDYRVSYFTDLISKVKAKD